MEDDPIRTLTEPQRQALRLVARGLETKDIARELGIKPAAVIDRIEGAREKLGGVRRRQAAYMLSAFEAADPISNGVKPNPIGVVQVTDFPDQDSAGQPGGIVREDRAVFTFGERAPLLERLGFWARTGLGLGFAIAMLVAASLIKPMIDGLAWIASVTARTFQ